MNRIATVVACLGLAIVGFTDTMAATINVPSDHPTIQGAIDASTHGDTISITAGTYYEQQINPGGKAITISSASGHVDVIIDAQQGGGVFYLNSQEGPETVIQNLVITGGVANYGGGIYCGNACNPTITGCTISGNTGQNGGGINCWSSSPNITDCTITDNTSTHYGGGIACNTSNSTIAGCMITNNTTGLGGGIYCWSSSPSITDCTITGNTATSNGGGIGCNTSYPTITNCAITDNTAGNGGGIYGWISNPTVTDTLVCGNVPNQIHGAWTNIDGNTIQAECPPSCQGDLDGNLVIDIEDLLLVIGGWNTASGDANDDGNTDIADLLLIIDTWGTNCS